jgi:hypothetical protein
MSKISRPILAPVRYLIVTATRSFRAALNRVIVLAR